MCFLSSFQSEWAPSHVGLGVVSVDLSLTYVYFLVFVRLYVLPCNDIKVKSSSPLPLVKSSDCQCHVTVTEFHINLSALILSDMYTA